MTEETHDKQKPIKQSLRKIIKGHQTQTNPEKATKKKKK